MIELLKLIRHSVLIAEENQQPALNEMNTAAANQGSAFNVGGPVPIFDKVDLKNYL